MKEVALAAGTLETRQGGLRAGSLVSGWMPAARLCCSGTLVLAQVLTAQPANPPVHEIKAGWFRVIAPAGVVPDRTYQRIVSAARSQLPLPGLPYDVLQSKQVTVSLALRMNADIVGWASTSDGLVVLRLSDVEGWDDMELYRNLRHELAHVALSRYLRDAAVPRWLSEGYSEFAAGGVTCEGEVRLSLLFRRGQRLQGGTLSQIRLDEIGNTRVGYDAAASFFEFLEASSKSSVSTGVMFANVRHFGVDGGLRRTFGASIEELERRWRTLARRKYYQTLHVATERCARPENQWP